MPKEYEWDVYDWTDTSTKLQVYLNCLAPEWEVFDILPGKDGGFVVICRREVKAE